MSTRPKPPVGAAFFDLDRTLLPGASGPELSAALREVGVLSARTIPGEALMFAVFDRIGETRPSMMLARQGVRLTKGWDAAKVATAGRLAAQRLAARIQPFAQILIDEQRSLGRLVVMATTSPAELADPLAELWGFDAAIATRYGRRDGTFTGTVDGRYVWGRDKREAVVEWAAGRDVDLGSSSAYSDSYYDGPLLSAVGEPVAVNPDPRLMAVATLKRWPVVWLDVPAGVRKFAGVDPQRALMKVIRPDLVPYCRFDIAGLEHLPTTGPAIVAANHRSYFDPVAIAFALARLGRPVRFLAKKELFDTAVVGQLARSFGAIPVDRGSGSAQPLEAAARCLAGGEVVVILPQGTIPRGDAFSDPHLEGKPGVVRLARATGAPVIPLGLWGTEAVWPRSSRLPNVVNIVNPPTVGVHLGPPMRLPGRSLATDLRHVMDAISGLAGHGAVGDRAPTGRDVARTYPRG